MGISFGLLPGLRILIVLAAYSQLALASSLQELLNAPHPPTYVQAKPFQAEVEAKIAQNSIRPHLKEGQRRLLVEALKQLLTWVPSHQLVLLGRAMNVLHEAIEPLLLAKPQYAALRDYFVLIPMSREIAANSSDEQLARWLATHGISVERMGETGEKIRVIDQGWVGQIPRRILSALLSSLPEESDPQLVAAVLENFDTLLFASQGEESFSQWRENHIRRGTEAKKIVGDLTRHAFYFGEIFTTPLSLQNWRLSSHRATRIEQIGDIFNNRNNWLPRATQLSDDGLTIEGYESERANESAINRLEVLGRILGTGDYVLSAPILKELEPFLDKAVARLSARGSNGRPSWKLLPGAIFKTTTDSYTVEQPIHESEKGIIYLLRGQKGPAVLKICDPDKEECLKSIAKDLKRSAELVAISAPTAKLLASGKHWLVREYIEGDDGKVWARGQKTKTNETEQSLKNLAALVRPFSERGIYLRNLRPSNLVRRKSDGQWVVIDTSGVVASLSAKEASDKYKDSFTSRWTAYLPESCIESLLKHMEVL